MIKVFLVDDHSFIRDGLKMISKEDSEIVVVGDAQDGIDALEKLKTAKIDVLVLDMNMPGRSGIELLTDIKTLYPNLKILVLSIHPADTFALHTLKAGASGYLCKDRVIEEFSQAVKDIYHTGKYINPTLIDQAIFNSDINPES